MADVLIKFTADTDGLKAEVKAVTEATDKIGEAASKAGKEAADSFKQAGQAAAAAFSSKEVKKSLDDQIKSVDELKIGIKQLYDEEIKLLSAGKKNSEAYKKNIEDAAKLRVELQKLTGGLVNQDKATDKLIGKSVSLKTQLKALKDELNKLEMQGKENTAQFAQTALAAAKLEDQISDTNERVRVLASDTFKFDAAVGAVQGLAAGFAVAQGAAALFGTESKELEKVVARTQGAIALLNGVQEVANLLTGQAPIKLAIMSATQKVNAASTVQAAAAQNLFGASILSSARAFNILKGAFIASGIGLVIVLVGELINYLDRLTAANERTKKTFEDASLSIKNNAKNLEDYKVRIINAQEQIAVSTGTLTEAQAKQNKQQREFTKELTDVLKPLYNAQQQLLVQEKNLLKEREAGSDNIGLAISREVGLKNTRIALAKVNAEIEKTTKLATQSLRSEIAAEKDSVESKEKVITVEDRVKHSIDDTNKSLIVQKDAFDALTDQSKLISLGETLVEFDARTNEELLTQRATFLKKEEILGRGGLDNRIDIITTEGKAKIAAIRDELGFTSDANNKIEIIEAETQAAIRAERKRTNEETIQQIFEYASAIQGVFNSLNELSKQQTENRIADINLQSQTELAAINASFDTERQKQRERSALELRTNRQIAAEKTKQAKQDKAIALFNAIIGTAQSIVKTGQQLGYPAAIPFQILAGVIGAAQIATIASKPIPKFEKGGWIKGKRHSQGGELIEGETDEFIVKRDRAVKHPKLLEAMNTSSRALSQYIDKNYVRPAVMNYMLGKKQDSMSVNVNATLNSQSMENEIKGLRRDMRKRINQSNKPDNRYSWHNQ